jgi:2-hydroxycyclohexanecarboxyl-CoA dehydrogenase
MQLEMMNEAAVVTGGASGIGLACARTLAREGCRVALWDVSPKTVEIAGAEFSHGIQVDIAERLSVENALRETERALGPVSHVVHAAAIGSGKFGFPFTNLQPEDWTKVLRINIMGMVQVAQALSPGMVERRFGTMVFIASIAGQIGSQTDPPYSASKAANINFAQCMAKDLAPHNVRVNVVCPGMVQTPLNRSVWQAWNNRQPPDQQRSYDDWAGEKVRTVAPLGRWQAPEDIADMVAFLSSKRAAQVTGQTINVDGGQVMHW